VEALLDLGHVDDPDDGGGAAADGGGHDYLVADFDGADACFVTCRGFRDSA